MRKCLILLALAALVYAKSSQKHKILTEVNSRSGNSRKLHQRNIQHPVKAYPAPAAAVDSKGDRDPGFGGGFGGGSGGGFGGGRWDKESDVSFSEVDANREQYGPEYKANVARYLVHKSEWCSLGTRASHVGLDGYTGVDVQLITDRINGKSTGIPYTYMSEDDLNVMDLYNDVRAGMMFSRATFDDNCKSLPLKAKDPACARTLLLGDMMHLDNTTQEYKDAYASLMEKFPALKDVDHSQYNVGKMNLKAVFVRGNDGRPQELPLDVYFAGKADGSGGGNGGEGGQENVTGKIG